MKISYPTRRATKMTPYVKSGATGTAFADIDDENEANVRRCETVLYLKKGGFAFSRDGGGERGR